VIALAKDDKDDKNGMNDKLDKLSELCPQNESIRLE
jgi:hypothetical protein